MRTRKMKNGAPRWLVTVAAFAFIFLVGACNDSETTDDIVGDWVKRSDFEGVGRSGAVSFTIGERVFIGTGFDGTNRLTDFWEYDAVKNTWYKRAVFPGAARNSAVAFSANGKGYVGTGYDGTNRLKDFYEYDPTTDSWRRVADFAGSARYGAVAASVKNKGFIGSGYDGNDLKDWWEFDPTNGAQGTWTQKVSIGGSKRSNAFTFVINGTVYLGGGTNNGLYPSDFWAYNPEEDIWKEKYALQDVNTNDDNSYDYILQRSYASTFVINGYGYLATGTYSSALSNVWQYNTTEDVWVQMTSFEGSAREAAIGFSVGNIGYITTGRSSASRFDDIWAFDPTLEADDSNTGW